MKKMCVWIVVLAVVFLSGGNAFAEVTGNIGVYSQYVSGTGTVADSRPVTQGKITKTFSSGLYLTGWFSQSLSNPGWDKTYGNEIDITLGWSGKITEKWHLDVHTAYYDLANDKLLKGSNGDLGDVGGTLRHYVNETTSLYSNAEYYYGLGSRGFSNGWKAGLGVQTVIMNMVLIDGILYHNEFCGYGEFAKITAETSKPIIKIIGGELRPTITWWQPLGKYKKEKDTNLVAGLRLNW